MKNQKHRKEIEQFCRDFVKGGNVYLHNLIDNYRHLFTRIDIQLNLTQETFDISFKRISRKLFDTRPADKSYIISLLGFALALHEFHLSHRYSWYHTVILMDSLTDVLMDVDFQSKEFIKEHTYCIIL